MYLLIVLPIAALLLAICCYINTSIYRKAYGENSEIAASFDAQIIEMHSMLNYSPNVRPFRISKNFFDYSASLITKAVIFAVCAILAYCFPKINLIVAIAHTILLLLTYFTFKGRYTMYRDLPASVEDSFRPCFYASITLPVYQTVLQLMLWAVYFV